jgi:hypothetical protein
VQYGDFLDDKARQSKARHLATPTARFYDYSIRTLNLPGPFPRIQGRAPFRDPYGYTWEHLDEWGRLGKFEWTARTQLLPQHDAFPLHRAFIPTNIPQFTFDPRVHIVESGSSNPDLRALDSQFLRRVTEAGASLSRGLDVVRRMTTTSKVELLSHPDFDWHFGASWLDLLRRAAEPHLTWKIAHIGEELRRRIADAIGYLIMAFRVFVYFLCYRDRRAPPRFRTSPSLMGLIVFDEHERSKLIGEGLAELGVPVWSAKVLNKEPRIETVPRGSVRDSDIWKEARREAMRRDSRFNERSHQGKEQLYALCEERLNQLVHARLALPVRNVWHLERGHPKDTKETGPFYRWHKSYLRKFQGFPGDNFLVHGLRWLQQAEGLGITRAFLELQEVLGKETLSSELLPNLGVMAPPLPLFHANYDLAEALAREGQFTWQAPPRFPLLNHPEALQTRLFDPSQRSYGAYPELLGRIEGGTPDPSSSRRYRSESPEERHTRRRIQPSEPFAGPSTSHHDAPPLPDYETLSDFTLHGDAEVDPEALHSPVAHSTEDDSRHVWDLDGSYKDSFPVELSPFFYPHTDDRLEVEACTRYGAAVKLWARTGNSLVLVFQNRKHAMMAIASQAKAAAVYPVEPSAEAISSVGLQVSTWSSAALEDVGEGVRVRRKFRLDVCPIPEPQVIYSARGAVAQVLTRPPDSVFQYKDLASFLYPSGSPETAEKGGSFRLMSRYRLAPATINWQLRERLQTMRDASVAHSAPIREATRTLAMILNRHMSYATPDGFRIALPLFGTPREAITFLTQYASFDSTSLLSRGTYQFEQFRWSPVAEEYEIVLDDLELEDIGISLTE